MRLLGSAALVAAGAIVIVFVGGSLRGVDVNTIGAVLLFVGFVAALVVVSRRAARGAPARRPDDEPGVYPRR